MRFRTTIELHGKTATGYRVPVEVVEALGKGRKKPAVRVTIGPHTYRSTVAAYGDDFFLPLSAENRTAAGVVAGQEIEVDIELDTEPREVSVPVDFAEALDAAPPARERFESLSYSNKRRYVLAVDAAKTPETRQRRIAKSVAELGT